MDNYIKKSKIISFVIIGIMTLSKLLASIFMDASTRGLIVAIGCSIFSIGWVFLNFNILTRQIKSKSILMFNNIEILTITEIILPILLLLIIEIIDASHIIQYALATVFTWILSIVLIALLAIGLVVNLTYTYSTKKTVSYD